MKITLHGAAGDVTGSAYLLETSQARVLVDFGLFQGGAGKAARNVLPSGLKVGRLDAVLVTHAHLDHTGRLPLLLKGGYGGPIYATAATIELAGLILRDSAKVQEQDAERNNRKRERAGLGLVKPLYTPDEVERTIRLFQPVPYDQPIPVAAGMSACYVEAGHMLGSASIALTVEEAGASKVAVFSGDVGPPGLALVRDSAPPPHADLVFLESTYGDRDHRPPEATASEFAEIIGEAAKSSAKVLVPAFAVGRTQQILYHLNELFSEGTVPAFPVYIDSPMAIEATKIYGKHPDLLDEAAAALQKRRVARRAKGYLHTCETAGESRRLNQIPGPCLIMAGSGMCDAGRILHHLRHNLWKRETVVMIVGYQAAGSLGRRLVDGAKQVRIFGDSIQVKARVTTLNGFSAHAGQSELLRWFEGMSGSKPRVILTHGENRAREPLAKAMLKRYGIRAELPVLGDLVRF